MRKRLRAIHKYSFCPRTGTPGMYKKGAISHSKGNRQASQRRAPKPWYRSVRFAVKTCISWAKGASVRTGALSSGLPASRMLTHVTWPNQSSRLMSATD